MDDLPLTKSLGYSLGKKLRNNLEDAQLNHEYFEQFQEMLRTSQEIYERFSGESENFYDKDGRRQRRAHRGASPAGRRRARSEAVRRQKLNSQSLKSHMDHTRHSSREGPSEEELSQESK